MQNAYSQYCCGIGNKEKENTMISWFVVLEEERFEGQSSCDNDDEEEEDDKDDDDVCCNDEWVQLWFPGFLLRNLGFDSLDHGLDVTVLNRVGRL